MKQKTKADKIINKTEKEKKRGKTEQKPETKQNKTATCQIGWVSRVHWEAVVGQKNVVDDVQQQNINTTTINDDNNNSNTTTTITTTNKQTTETERPRGGGRLQLEVIHYRLP